MTVLKTATTLKEASNAVLLKFERPADQSESAQNRRASYGQKYYDQYVLKIYDLKQFIKDVQKACGAQVDGIAGNETLRKTPTISAKKNNKPQVVEYIQKRLVELGYSEVGKADGVAGAKFTSAVAHFQEDNGCYVDGEMAEWSKTWFKLLGMK